MTEIPKNESRQFLFVPSPTVEVEPKIMQDHTNEELHKLQIATNLAASATDALSAIAHDHSSRHEDGGLDEISIEGLAGVSITGQNAASMQSYAVSAASVKDDQCQVWDFTLRAYTPRFCPKMADTDKDTTIQMEAADDEDAIRFATGGTEAGSFDSSQGLTVHGVLSVHGASVLQGSARLAQMKYLLYTGDGTTSQAITGAGFQPLKVEILRTVESGTEVELYVGYAALGDDNCLVHQNAAGAEHKNRSDKIISLDADGFTVDDAGGDNHPNKNTKEYVAICWR